MLDYARPGHPVPGGETSAPAAGHVLAALIVAGLALAGILVLVAAFAALAATARSDELIWAAWLVGLILAAAVSVLVFVAALRTYGRDARASPPAPSTVPDADEQDPR